MNWLKNLDILDSRLVDSGPPRVNMGVVQIYRILEYKCFDMVNTGQITG